MKEKKNHYLEQEANLTEYNQTINTNKESKKAVDKAKNAKDKKSVSSSQTVSVNSQVETNSHFETMRTENKSLQKEVFDLKRILKTETSC